MIKSKQCEHRFLHDDPVKNCMHNVTDLKLESLAYVSYNGIAHNKNTWGICLNVGLLKDTKHFCLVPCDFKYIPRDYFINKQRS